MFQLIRCTPGEASSLRLIKPREAAVRLRKGLFVSVDPSVDVLGELLKDRGLFTQRVPWEQTTHQNGEEYPCREQGPQAVDDVRNRSLALSCYEKT